MARLLTEVFAIAIIACAQPWPTLALSWSWPSRSRADALSVCTLDRIPLLHLFALSINYLQMREHTFAHPRVAPYASGDEDDDEDDIDDARAFVAKINEFASATGAAHSGHTVYMSIYIHEHMCAQRIATKPDLLRGEHMLQVESNNVSVVAFFWLCFVRV